MDRRGKKLERKRVKRAQDKKKAKAAAARKPSAIALLTRAAARGGFGPCFVSAGWDDPEVPALVTLLVTREVAGGLVPAVALVDRTCLGIKDGFVRDAMFTRELADFVDELGAAHGGMIDCQPLVAQSIAFHAIDYARKLGFEPHADFPSALFGPRPEQLLQTPWHAPEQPIYVSGPHDDARSILRRLTQAVGADGFEYVDPLALPDDDDDDFENDVGDDDEELVHSSLESTVSRDGISLRILIYRGARDARWLLEVEDATGGSTVWDEPFETDQAAFDEAMRAIEESGIEAFVTANTASLG